jgi:hypothetical protein
MRRTTSNRLVAPLGAAIELAALPCSRCGQVGCTVLVMGSNTNGAIELAFCTPLCASLAGARRYLRSERLKPKGKHT